MRFARNVQFQVKSGKETELNNAFEKEALPVLRKQNGFQQGVTLVNPKDAHFISLWDNQKNAEAYATTTYPQVLAKLTRSSLELPAWRPTKPHPATLARNRASGGAY